LVSCGDLAIISLRRHSDGEPNYFYNENDGSGDDDGCDAA